MYIARATTRTGYVARGIAGKEAASCVHSHQTAASDILFGGYFYGHVARGIASGQGGTRWKVSNPENAPAFSATAFNFAMMMNQVLDIPIGIINCSWGWQQYFSKNILTLKRHMDCAIP